MTTSLNRIGFSADPDSQCRKQGVIHWKGACGVYRISCAIEATSHKKQIQAVWLTPRAVLQIIPCEQYKYTFSTPETHTHPTHKSYAATRVLGTILQDSSKMHCIYIISEDRCFSVSPVCCCSPQITLRSAQRSPPPSLLSPRHRYIFRYLSIPLLAGYIKIGNNKIYIFMFYLRINS